MCGIVGYIGKKQAFPIILNGLKRLEYRGYDSAGIAMLSSTNQLNIYKKKGKVNALEQAAEGHDISGTVGMGHTRWATHGEANDMNAHPHFNTNGDLAMIHNGIIENYYSIKIELQTRGYKFSMKRILKCLVHLIEDIQKNAEVEFGRSSSACPG